MDDSLTLASEFPAPSEQDWLDAVAAAMKGRPLDRLRTTTEDGLVLEPLYTATSVAVADDEHGRPGSAPFLRGRSTTPTVWDVRAEHRQPDLARLNDAVLTDLQRGVTSIGLRFDAEARLGRSAWSGDDVGVDGAPIRTAAQLSRALDGVLLDLAPVALDAGHAGPAAARAFLDLVGAAGIAAADARGSLGVDPLAARAAAGWAPDDTARLLEQACSLAVEVAGRHPEMTALGLSTTPYVDAGATSVQELALLIASAAELVRAADRAGTPIDVVLGRVEATVSVDADVFGSIAKLRAARWMWARLAEACGVPAAGRAVALHARTADRMFSRTDPWVNLLRSTAACFAAAVGGADGMTVLPYDRAIGVAEGFGRRLARNTQVVLAEESHLARVVDPGGGSWYLEARTRQLAEAAWARFQAIESSGGLLAGLRDGSLAAELAEAHEARAKRIATRRSPLTGVSEFPFLGEDPVPTDAVDLDTIRGALAADGPPPADAIAPSRGDEERGEPLPVHRLAAPFDDLRAAADGHRRRTGARPTVFLANLGPLAEHTARTGFARNLFAAGGIDAVGPEGPTRDELLAAFVAVGTSVACLCSSDDRYGTEGAEVAAALRAAGAQHVIVAGRVEVDGVDEQIAIGTDVIDVCTRLHDRLEVRP
ncbi:MAG: methylmalonyl-CoA mutase family protein [Actinomycetota bacterium]